MEPMTNNVNDGKSWFPAEILLVDSNEKMVCKTVNDIPGGKTFKVLQTRVEVE